MLATIVTPIATGLAMFLVVTAYPAPVSGAGTLTVTNCHDSGAGSLRAEIASATAGDTVNFFVSCPATSPITLASTLDINTNLNISGPGTTRLVVSGNHAVGDFDVASGVTATISGLTIEDGNAAYNGTPAYNPNDISGGGAILNFGDVTITDSTLSNNEATDNGSGGAIFNNSGTVNLTDSTVSDNQTPGNNGNGIYNYFGGTLSITHSTVSNNSGLIPAPNSGASSSGSAIYNQQSTLTITDSTVSNNIGGQGGAIDNAGGQATITGSVVSGNQSGQGTICNCSGSLTIADSTLSGNTVIPGEGGGILNNGGNVIVTASTLAGNSSAVGGGGIWNNGTVTITDSTLSGNSTTNNGGGIDNGGTMTITGSTLSENSASGYGGGIENDNGTLTLTISTLYRNTAAAGGAIYNLYDAGTVAMVASTLSNNGGSAIYNVQGTVSAKATIVANSTPSGGCEGDGTFTDLGYNLNDDGTCQFTTSTSLPDTPSGLDPAGLQNNGGPTQTIALEPGSAAIKHITNAAFCLPTDQRGYSVTVPCDIGAYDTGAVPPGFCPPRPSPPVVNRPRPPPPVVKQPPPSKYGH